MTTSKEKKNYPNLEKCAVIVSPRYTSSITTVAPIEQVNPDWIYAAEAALPELYTFNVGTYTLCNCPTFLYDGYCKIIEHFAKKRGYCRGK